MIRLPNENWHDVFCFLKKSKLASVALVNHHFSLLAGNLLHNSGSRTLLPLVMEWHGKFFRPGDLRPLLTMIWSPKPNYMDVFNIPIPQVPAPRNIKAFQQIELNYLDPGVCIFLRQLVHLLRNGVHLRITGNNNESRNARALFILDEFNLLNSDWVHSVTLMGNLMPLMMGYSQLKGNSSLHPVQIPALFDRVCVFCVEGLHGVNNVQALLSWLEKERFWNGAPLAIDLPKLMTLRHMQEDCVKLFLEGAAGRFLLATHPAPFIVHIHAPFDLGRFANIRATNAVTDERLSLQQVGRDALFRRSMQTQEEEEWEDMEQKLIEWSHEGQPTQRILIDIEMINIDFHP